MSTFYFLLVACLITLAASRPEISENNPTDTNVGQSGATEERNPILEYLTNRNTLPPGGKREITYLQAFPTQASLKHQNAPKKPQSYQRDPTKSPYQNFNGFIVAGRKPDVVESPVLNVKANKTRVDVVPAVATIIRTYDEHGTLRSSLTRYEPAVGDSTRQQISWPYAGYFPILIKDPFLTAFHALAGGNGFSLSSLIEYGPEADICQKSETAEQHEKHSRRKRQIEEREETGKRRVMALARTTRLTVSDPEKGLASIRIENPEPNSDEVPVSVRKGGHSIAGPGGFATAYTGGTAVVGPYGTVFKSPEGVAVAGPHSRIINITDDTNLDEILRMYEAAKANKTVPLQGRNEAVNSYQTVKNLFSYKTNQTVNFLKHGDLNKARKLSQVIERAENSYGSQNGETTLVFAPESKSEAKDNGMAISIPVSRAVVYPNRNTHIVFQPLTSASAGSGGLAHAHSDLYVQYVKNETSGYGWRALISALHAISGAGIPSVVPEGVQVWRLAAHDTYKYYNWLTKNSQQMELDFSRDSFYQGDDIEARANVVLPPLSTILMPPVRGYDQKKKKPSKPDKEEESEEENVGEEHEESNNQESSDAVAINPPPEGASVAEAKPVGLAIAGPGGVASSKPVAQAIVGPGGLAIARPVGTAVAGVEVEGSIPLGGQQQKQKPQKKKPKQEYDLDPDTELQYVGGLSGPIGSPKPKHTPPETNYIGGLRGVVGNPIPKHETQPSARQFNQYQFKLGEFNGKYGFLPFVPQTDGNERQMGKRMDTPTFFHGMIGSHGHNMPASVYPLVYY